MRLSLVFPWASAKAPYSSTNSSVQLEVLLFEWFLVNKHSQVCVIATGFQILMAFYASCSSAVYNLNNSWNHLLSPVLASTSKLSPTSWLLLWTSIYDE